MIYCRAKFGEGLLGRGMGFGNRLFPWARCRIFAKQHGAQVVSPVWTRPALGQILRGGVDSRSYLRQLVLFRLFVKRAGDLGVLEGFVKTRRMPVLPEPKDLAIFLQLDVEGQDVNVVFQGYERYFEPLNGWSDFLLSELRAITRPAYLALADATANVPIGICVRCGNDFLEPEESCERLLPGQKTPISWFVRCLELVREVAGFPVQAFVVSDGTPRQLKKLLAMENVKFVRPGSAISDLLILSRAKVLLASGSSSFAAWGAFLGQMPGATHPGQPLSDWKITPSQGQFLGEVNLTDPPQEFLSQVARALGSEAIDDGV